MSLGWRLDQHARFGMRAGPGMRQTLLRVLTELYLQKPTHTADEEQHYSELALRLLDAVDVGTRANVAERLARYPSPPMRVLERLARDLPEVAAHLRDSPTSQQVVRLIGSTRNGAEFTAPPPLSADLASELNDLFFAANGDERRLILLNLDVVAPFPAGRIQLSGAADSGDRLEAAVLARNRDSFAQQLAQVLHISRSQARRLADDDLGEPIVTAARALDMGRGTLYRILLFVNMRIGHSVARVQALAELHHELPRRAAEQMVAIWQSLPRADQPSERHMPLFWDDTAPHKTTTKLLARPVQTNPALAERHSASKSSLAS
jgi:hypothetical protein